MSHRVSETTKIREKRGTGHGANYKPWIKVSEFPGHLGVHHNLVDWKHGRQLQLLSDGELWQYLMLRWDENVKDIREQFPLDIEVTKLLFDKYKGFKHPQIGGELVHMTSDLLVDYTDGHQEVYSVKYSREDLSEESGTAENTARKLWIEKKYWEGQGVAYHLVFTNEMNRAFAENIAQIIYYWKPETVTDKVSLFKFLLAHKQIEVDIESHPVDALEFSKLSKLFISDDEAINLLKDIKMLNNVAIIYS